MANVIAESPWTYTSFGYFLSRKENTYTKTINIK